MISKISALWEDILSFFFPDFCLGCGTRLSSPRRYLCSKCLESLPRNTGYEALFKSDERLQGLIPYGELRSDLIFREESLTREIIHEIKYRKHPDLGYKLGRLYGEEHRRHHDFEDISMVIPIPVAPERLRKRGYNQSEYIARGLAESLGIEMYTDLLHRRGGGTQTRRGKLSRWESLEGAFRCEPGCVMGRRLLLVDDILTSGSTLIHAARCLYEVGGAESISFYTLAVDTYV